MRYAGNVFRIALKQGRESADPRAVGIAAIHALHGQGRSGRKASFGLLATNSSSICLRVFFCSLMVNVLVLYRCRR